MFGFMGSPCRSCASGETHSTYRGFFCGLSGALRADYSPAARFLVNRDSTFLSLITAAVSPHEPVAVSSTCCNPISIPRPLYQDDLHARYAAAVTVCGLATKLEDDRVDETGLRRTVAGLLGRTISPMTDRATSFLNTIRFPTAEVVEMMQEQDVIESRKPDLLEAASPTAMAYGTIFNHAAKISEAPESGDHLDSLGSKLGQLVYWKDAHDDLSEDQKRGRFNPLNRAEPEEFEDLFSRTTSEFNTLAQAAPLGRLQHLVQEILSNTLFRHQALLPAGALANMPSPDLDSPESRQKWEEQERKKIRKEERRKARKEKNGCCSKCDDCCPSCGCDPCFDCGPGDSGCCDCSDCCPCGN